MQHTIKGLIVWICLLAAVPAIAQQGGPVDPLFADDNILDVTLTAPLTTLVRERPDEEYLAGTFEYADSSGAVTALDVGLRSRGHFRLQTCDFPPLRLNFKKSAVKGTLFDGQDKLKLVVHCDDSERYQQYVLREYLAYRVFNLLTDKSFRVRLLRVNYVDNQGRRKDQVRYAFLIEHKKRLAKRIGMPVYNVEDAELTSLDGEYLNLTSLFQYFIANTDFSPIAGPPDSNCCHNYVLFRGDDEPVTAIPYDFDQSGFVDAPYANPDSRLRIRDVTQRVYRGRCLFNDYVDESIAAFSIMREPIVELIETQPGTTDRVKKNLRKFIDRFYDVVENPERVERDILGKCRG